MNEPEVSIVQSGLRGTVRWRGRVRGQFTAWSVLAAAAFVIVLGGLFWASVWVVLRGPAKRAPS